MKVHCQVLLAVDRQDKKQVSAPLSRGLYPVRHLLQQSLEKPLGVAPDEETGSKPGPLREGIWKRVANVRPAVSVNAVLPPLNDIVGMLGLVLPSTVLDSLNGHFPRTLTIIVEEAHDVRKQPGVVVIPIRQAGDEET